ncbi:hypothetical protein N9452_09730 [Alphaproteobacteria bacterium]|nr:hypothetical protein [Alphaproteobacteria bacterium]
MKFWPSGRTAAGGIFVGKEAACDRAALLPGGGMTRGDGSKFPDTDGGMTLGVVAVRLDGGATAGADGTTTLDGTGGVTWGATAGGNGTATCGGAEDCSADFGKAGTIGTGGAALETTGFGTRGDGAALLLVAVGATGSEAGL